MPEQPASESYPYTVTVPTRWQDNDQFGHVNNTVHYGVMDTVINDWLRSAGFEHGGGVVNLIPESGCRYLAEIAYPDPFVVGLRVERLGRTSVGWGLELRRGSDGVVVGTGRVVHVFVDRRTRRPVPVPETLRPALEALVGSGGGPRSR